MTFSKWRLAIIMTFRLPICRHIFVDYSIISISEGRECIPDESYSLNVNHHVIWM